jgi:aldehyde dehydrogenase (NAD+)
MATTLQRIAVPKGQLIINGKWRDSSDSDAMTTTDPTTEMPITTFAKATPEDAEAAVQAAYNAFENGPWSRMYHEERAKILFRVADLLDGRAERFALLEAMDMGMPYKDFVTIILPYCSGLFRFFGGLAMSAMGGEYRTSYETNIKILTRRQVA